MIEFLMGCAFAGMDADSKSRERTAFQYSAPSITTLPDGTIVKRRGRVEQMLDMRPGMIIDIED